jgi:hypothetical protein
METEITLYHYPADYSLQDWLFLRRGWLDPHGDTARWERAQKSTLGPNPTQKTLDFKKSPYGVETHLQR